MLNIFKAYKAKRAETKANKAKLKAHQAETEMLQENLKLQIEDALEALMLARQDEQYADEAHREVAIERVKIAQDNLSNLYKQAKILF